MSGLQKIRKEYGLTQEQFSTYLGVSRGLLSMVEKGRRYFPTRALIKLSAFLTDNPVATVAPREKAPAADIFQWEKAETARQLAHHCEDRGIKAARLAMRLQQMQQQYNACVLQLKKIEALWASLPGGGEGEKDEAWLRMQQLTLRQQMRHCGKAAQSLLQAKMEALRYEAQLLGNMMP